MVLVPGALASPTNLLKMQSVQSCDGLLAQLAGRTFLSGCMCESVSGRDSHLNQETESKSTLTSVSRHPPICGGPTRTEDGARLNSLLELGLSSSPALGPWSSWFLDLRAQAELCY